MIYLGIGWEVLVLLFLLWIIIRTILKSMDRRLDKLFPSYDQKRGNGEGATSTPTGYEYRGEG